MAAIASVAATGTQSRTVPTVRVSKSTSLTIAAGGVGAVSTVLGGLLAAAPHAGGRWLGLIGTSVNYRRALGIADLGLGITTIAGRSSS
ncbi:hypothetical protein [Microbacterium sp.]|uniref:hypothetical protein n=1 Tax=Microbacterium sp. TaxID=51671 RepID=UPI0027363D48|nr:hypothetical protein [Microbacterium sp.]MDP3949490.1 hypothetical protein [Microbacterium sp.]